MGLTDGKELGYIYKTLLYAHFKLNNIINDTMPRYILYMGVKTLVGFTDGKS